MIQEKIRKYLGGCCGNTFVIFDCRGLQISKKDKIDLSLVYIKKYNVDSALVINNLTGFDLFLEIFEEDGSESESCGNGLILVTYLLDMKEGIIKFGNSIFTISNGPETQIISIDTNTVYTKENNSEPNCLFVKVGEPHLIYFVKNIKKFDLVKKGKEVQKYYPHGVNVDVIQKDDEFHYLIRTYERGVFKETKSCGTGSLSAYFAICYFNDKMKEQSIDFRSAGGEHWISMEKKILSLEILKEFCHIENLN
jgi:diaminopimelate epimerase